MCGTKEKNFKRANKKLNTNKFVQTGFSPCTHADTCLRCLPSGKFRFRYHASLVLDSLIKY